MEKIETRNKILQASKQLFVSKGYFNTTIPDIVKESGVSVGSIYHYFGNKQNLAKRLYEQTLNDYKHKLDQRLSGLTDTEDKLSTVLNQLLETADDDLLELEYMLFVKHQEIDEALLPICLSGPFEFVGQLLRAGVAEGKVKDLPSEILAAGYLGPALKLVELKINGVIKYTLISHQRDVQNICWDSVKL